MTYREILERESQNEDRIYLYREGLFLKAYDRSAYFAYVLVHPFKVSCRYVKSVNEDVFSLGFPEATLPKWLNGYVCEQVQPGLFSCRTRKAFDEVEYQNWKEAVSVNVSNRYTPHTSMIEKTPVYKTSYDLFIQVCVLSANISKNVQNPLGLRLKDLGYRLSYSVRTMYDVSDQVAHIDGAIDIVKEMEYILQVLKDLKEISIKTFALASERTVSVGKQLSALRGKAMAKVHGG